MNNRFLVLGATWIAATLAGACSAETRDPEPAAADELRESVSPGSYTVSRGAENELDLPDVPYRSAAGLVLRADGTAFVQLAPRFTATKYDDDSHMTGAADGLEVVGAWIGMEATWKQRGEELVLQPSTEDAAPVVFHVKVLADGLRITDPAYAGTQSGQADVLRRLPEDCRLERTDSTDEERAVDAEYDRVQLLGLPNETPFGRYVPDLVGDVEARCPDGRGESALRTVWRDRESNAAKLVGITYSPEPFVISEQRYLYDEAGRLRLVVTTTERTEPGQRSELEEVRTYFDEVGQPTRSLVQPRLTQARSQEPTRSLVAGRRFTSVEDPLSVVDLPRCKGAAAPLYAAAPLDAELSIAAPLRCE